MMLTARITVSKKTVNQMVKALQKAYKSGDARMIKRISVLLDFSRGDQVENIAERHGVSRASIYEWVKRLLIEGVAGLKPTWKGGRPAKLTKSQKKELGKLIDAGPEAAGFRSGCWNSAMIQKLILIDFFTGQFFYQGIEGRFNSDSYIAFIAYVLEQTTAPIFLIQDGARYHTSKKTKQFFAQHADRLTVFQLPSYSPDYNPIEYLWRNVKKEATHLKYFPTFEELITTVETTLAGFQQQPDRIKALFGRYLKLMVDSNSDGQFVDLAA